MTIRPPLLGQCLRRLCAAFALGALAALAAGCASLPAPAPLPRTEALGDVGQTRLARLAAQPSPGTPGPAAGASGFRLLPEGEFAYDARIALARNAEKSLDVQYYLVQNDPLGRLLLRELRDAALRGVRVRLLVDDLYAAGEDDLYRGLAAYPNAQVRIFNPFPVRAGSVTSRVLFSMHEFGRINHRMHNKLFVADNSFAVSGGRNVAAEYFMRSEEANFVDLDVLSSGPVVREFSRAFDLYWNSPYVYPIEQLVRAGTTREAAQRRFDELVREANPDIPLRERDVLLRTPVSVQLERGEVERIYAPARVVVDHPDKITREGEERRRGSVLETVLQLFGQSRRNITIVSPYFIPGEKNVETMRQAHAAGVRIVLLTNSLGATDEPLVYWRYARYREAMLRAGVTIYELSPSLVRASGEFGMFGRSLGRLHAKLAIIDEKQLFVGSMNLDGRSALLNTEVGLIVDSPELVADVRRLQIRDDVRSAYRLRLRGDGPGVEWLEHTAEGTIRVHADEPDATPLLRLKNWLLSPFVVEEFL